MSVPYRSSAASFGGSVRKVANEFDNLIERVHLAIWPHTDKDELSRLLDANPILLSSRYGKNEDTLLHRYHYILVFRGEAKKKIFLQDSATWKDTATEFPPEAEGPGHKRTELQRQNSIASCSAHSQRRNCGYASGGWCRCQHSGLLRGRTHAPGLQGKSSPPKQTAPPCSFQQSTKEFNFRQDRSPSCAPCC